MREEKKEKDDVTVLKSIEMVYWKKHVNQITNHLYPIT